MYEEIPLKSSAFKIVGGNMEVTFMVPYPKYHLLKQKPFCSWLLQTFLIGCSPLCWVSGCSQEFLDPQEQFFRDCKRLQMKRKVRRDPYHGKVIANLESSTLPKVCPFHTCYSRTCMIKSCVSTISSSSSHHILFLTSLLKNLNTVEWRIKQRGKKESNLEMHVVERFPPPLTK